MKLTAFLALLIGVCCAECSKILVVFPMRARSHYILGNALAKGLAEAGHDVTMVSPFEDKSPAKNGTYRDVVLTGFAEKAKGAPAISFFDFEKLNPFLMITFTNSKGVEITRLTLEDPNFQKLLKSNEHFDLVILQQVNNDALKALAHHYKAPLILFSTIRANAAVNTLIGNPAPPSYIPEIFFSYSSNMSFKERLINWLFCAATELHKHFIYYPEQDRLIKEFFPQAPDLSQLNYNASLVFLNAHESIHQAVPQVPSMVYVGGIHVSPPKELPKDLKEFLDNAKDGVVYFSLGSNIKPSQMTDDKREAILGALGKLKEKVLWKWDEDTLPGKPDNVMLSKWFPQQDILAHPNIKLFITHGGLLSTTETIYHGVPILAFPVFGDQKMNAANAEADGYGLCIPFSDVTEEKITSALNKLLNSAKYRENVKKRSRLLHDRPVKPLDLAVYWSEYIIRHGGAPHLRVAGVDLPWYIYFSFDVIAFVILVSLGSLCAIYFATKKVCCARSTKKEKSKKD